MIDLAAAIAPKSDQLNADDLIAGPRTIVIARVTARPGEQPVSIHFEGDDGKPYKPCKSMLRVLALVWGMDGASYIGRRMTLYRDPAVVFGGVAVGGIRISHMSHIDAPKTMALTHTRASRKLFTVRPLETAASSPEARQGGVGAPPASAPPAFSFAGAEFDPARPQALLTLPLRIDEMDGDDWRKYGAALGALIKAAPAHLKPAWLERNAPELLRLKALHPSWVSALHDLVSPASAGESGASDDRGLGSDAPQSAEAS